MSEFTPQSTDQLPSDTSSDTERVLYRGRVRVATTDYTISGSYYYASKSIDFGQFRVSNLLNVDVWLDDGQVYKAPFTTFSDSGGTPTVSQNCYFFLTNGDKFSSTSLKLVIGLMNKTGGTIDLYFQIKSTSAARGDMFPLLSS